jgi:murein DD-endopeptidase MepM/ murein hydrolase activator NlpD
VPSRQVEVTGSITPRAHPTGTVVSQPLPTPSAPQTVAASTGGYSSGSVGLGSYRPTRGVDSDITGTVPSHQAPPKPAGSWTWDGGSPVTVGQGETAEMIARRHGVPLTALLQTNGIANPAMVRPGQRLVIPRYIPAQTASAAPAPRMAAPAAAPVAAAAPAIAGGTVHIVEPGESLIAIARRSGMSLGALARANNIQPYTKVNIGDRITIPAGHHVAVRAKPAPQQQIAQQQPAAAPKAAPQIEKVATAPAQNVRMATQEPPKVETPSAKAEAVGGMPSFRWPVHGRIIAGFGARPNGAQNDGINLAVPEGTPVKAADDGVVAYAGNELKGYGNLVLIRHANGYVSAYANASKLLVKRGDAIKRGQVIAHAGQTGNVTSPQLHFEIRKGSTPVDPTKYLSGV